MSEPYEILPVRRKTSTGQEVVTIPKTSELYGSKYVKIVRLKE